MIKVPVHGFPFPFGDRKRMVGSNAQLFEDQEREPFLFHHVPFAVTLVRIVFMKED